MPHFQRKSISDCQAPGTCTPIDGIAMRQLIQLWVSLVGWSLCRLKRSREFPWRKGSFLLLLGVTSLPVGVVSFSIVTVHPVQRQLSSGYLLETLRVASELSVVTPTHHEATGSSTLPSTIDGTCWFGTEEWQISPLPSTTGFCNSLFLVQSLDIPLSKHTHNKQSKNTTTILGIIKVYSDLAKERMRVSPMQPVGWLDRQLGDLGLGPRILEASSDALYMEYLSEGTTLTETQVHQPGQSHILNATAMALAQLHTLHHPSYTTKSILSRPNMLWDSLETLIGHISDNKTKHYYQEQVAYQRSILESIQLPIVLGHGDFKPSNVWVTPTSSQPIRLVDLETAGWHYRAYDLAKFFRTSQPTPYTKVNQEQFFENYLQACSKQKQEDKSSWDLLLLEAQIALPMTWLEAAIFFQAQHYEALDGSSTSTNSWKGMARDRTKSYQESCNEEWRQRVEVYRQRMDQTSIR